MNWLYSRQCVLAGKPTIYIALNLGWVWYPRIRNPFYQQVTEAWVTNEIPYFMQVMITHPRRNLKSGSA